MVLCGAVIGHAWIRKLNPDRALLWTMVGLPHEGGKAVELARQELHFSPDPALAYERTADRQGKSRSPRT
jgi:hypothetical protein